MYYFDNAATSYPKPEEVYETLVDAMKKKVEIRAGVAILWPSRLQEQSMLQGKNWLLCLT